MQLNYVSNIKQKTKNTILYTFVHQIKWQQITKNLLKYMPVGLNESRKESLLCILMKKKLQHALL